LKNIIANKSQIKQELSPSEHSINIDLLPQLERFKGAVKENLGIDLDSFQVYTLIGYLSSQQVKPAEDLATRSPQQLLALIE